MTKRSRSSYRSASGRIVPSTLGELSGLLVGTLLVATAILVVADGCSRPRKRIVRIPTRIPSSTDVSTPARHETNAIDIDTADLDAIRRDVIRQRESALEIRRGSSWSAVLSVSGPTRELSAPPPSRATAEALMRPVDTAPALKPVEEPGAPGDVVVDLTEPVDPAPRSEPVEEPIDLTEPIESSDLRGADEATIVGAADTADIDHADLPVAGEESDDGAGDLSESIGSESIDLESIDLESAESGSVEDASDMESAELIDETDELGAAPEAPTPPSSPGARRLDVLDIILRAAGLGSRSREGPTPPPADETMEIDDADDESAETESGDAEEGEDESSGEEAEGDESESDGSDAAESTAGSDSDAIFEEIRRADRERRRQATALFREAEDLFHRGELDRARAAGVRATELHPGLAADVEKLLARIESHRAEREQRERAQR